MFKKARSVDIAPDAYDRYRAYAHRENLSVEDWVRRTLDQAAPRANEGANAAFRYLDMDPMLAPKRVLPIHENTTVGHPCRWLENHPPTGWTGTTCSGTCRHPRATRPACTWPAPSASNCRIFTPK